MRAIPFTVTFPGARPNLGDPDVDTRTERILALGIDALIESAIVLAEYIAIAHSPPQVLSAVELQAVALARQRIQEEVATKRALAHWESGDEELQCEVHRRLVPDVMVRGVVPALYAHQRPFIYAKSFVLSLDALRRVIQHIADEPLTANAGRAALDALNAVIPHLAVVRDSTAHADERVLGEARGRSIQAKPITSGAVRAPKGGIMMLGSLISDCFGYTTHNGEYGEVPIKLETHQACVGCFQGLIENLRWQGAPHVVPAL